MFIELHLLQNFAPSNLNRDDTGAPKDCEFGQHRRARISSQCLKRTAREFVRDEELLPAAARATRSRRFVQELVQRMKAQGKNEEEARRVVTTALGGIELKVDEKNQTEYLLYLGQRELDQLATECLNHWDALSAASAQSVEGEAGAGGKKKGAKKAAKDAVPADVQKALKAALDGRRAADLAMYGRMLADLPGRNVDAASQVAHAISTHRVSMEFDYYTAVDDLNKEDAGAGMIGTTEFNSACYYRYSNVDFDQLIDNLGDAELAREALRAYLRASVMAVPTGKQNSFASPTPPALVLAVVRDAGLWSLANAFERPVRADDAEGLMEKSVRALDQHFGQLRALYGDYSGIRQAFVATLHRDSLQALQEAQVGSVPDLVESVVNEIIPADGSNGGAR
ncbi:MAG: type I-E CRISPR-associated protein Cas7/Cse4/CasC [Pyrinomonadaceae bacterium]